MKQRLKKLPRFSSEAKEREFWATHDSTDYIDWSKAKRMRFPNLRMTTTSISLRLPESMLEEIKILARKRDVPYQSFIKMTIANRIEEERERV